MIDYRIPKEETRVLMSVPPQPPVERTLFLSSVAETHDGMEMVSDLLNNARRFLPTVDAGVGLDLVRTEAIRWILVCNPAKAEWRFQELSLGVPRARIRFVFSDGEEIDGIIYIFTQPGVQRVLDVVNLSKGFIHLENAEGLHLINPDHVARILILEEEYGCPRQVA
jgi:hypothetical protein